MPCISRYCSAKQRSSKKLFMGQRNVFWGTPDKPIFKLNLLYRRFWSSTITLFSIISDDKLHMLTLIWLDVTFCYTRESFYQFGRMKTPNWPRDWRINFPFCIHLTIESVGGNHQRHLNSKTVRFVFVTNRCFVLIAGGL